MNENGDASSLPAVSGEPLTEQAERFIEFCVEQLPEEELPPGAPRLESGEQHRNRVRMALRESVQNFTTYARRGLELYGESEHAEIAGRIIRQAGESEAAGQEFDCADADFNPLFKHAMQKMLDGEIEHAQPMFAVLIALRPWDSQSYVGMLSGMWQTDGVEKTAEVYWLLNSVWHDPELAFFGADCLRHANRIAEAREIAERSLHELRSDDDEEDQALIQQHIGRLEGLLTEI